MLRLFDKIGDRQPRRKLPKHVQSVRSLVNAAGQASIQNELHLWGAVLVLVVFDVLDAFL